MKSMRNNLRLFNACVLTLTFVLPMLGTQSHAQEKPTPAHLELPATLIGTWQVTKVNIDTGASRRMLYQYNDPRLTGRLFTIAREQLTNNTPESQLCVNPKVVMHRTTALKLIGNNMAGRGYVPETPTPKDYELPLANNAPVDVLSVSCKDGLFEGGLGPVEGMRGAWIIVLHKDQLAIRWYDETILLLRRLPDNAKPVASFDCHKAVTVVEKTICGSVALAAFDQSVAQAYKFAEKFFKEVENPEALTQLKITQKKWLTQRNACGADVHCLEKSMEDRLEAIETAKE